MPSVKLIKFMELIANLLVLLAILFISLLAFTLQLVFEELPCPLCLLQRIGFLFMAFGLLLNFRFGFRPSHYAIVLLSGLFTSFVALRQIALHVIPGTGSYGSAILGLHLYSWSFLIAMAVMIATALLLSVDRQYTKGNVIAHPEWSGLIHVLFSIVGALILINLVSVILQCGFAICPDNPTKYELLHHIFTHSG